MLIWVRVMNCHLISWDLIGTCCGIYVTWACLKIGFSPLCPIFFGDMMIIRSNQCSFQPGSPLNQPIDGLGPPYPHQPYPGPWNKSSGI